MSSIQDKKTKAKLQAKKTTTKKKTSVKKITDKKTDAHSYEDADQPFA